MRFNRRIGGLCAASLTISCAGAPKGPPTEPPARSRYGGERLSGLRPLTRAERTGFLETSHYADVVQFIDSLRALGAGISVGSIGKTSEGRDIPYVIASRPLVTTPDEAHRLSRPVVYVQADIHAGEVEGKEALQSLLRDLLQDRGANVLDSLVLIAVPIYNADGNERFAPQERNRTEQNGPDMVGQRPNAQGLDLNRDYVKAEAPETRASLAMFSRWDPDVFVDLHTTDGSFHGYALTYAPSLNPAALIAGPYTRDTMLVELRRRMRERNGWEIFDYGNFISQDSARRGWFTYEPLPRYGTNYYGLRGRISILSEAYSHDPFKRRVASTYDFVREILSYVSEHAPAIVALSRRADQQVVDWGTNPSTAPPIPLRSVMTTHPYTGTVLVEELAPTGDSVRTQPGVPPGLRRTGIVRAVTMPVYDRFDPAFRQGMTYALIFSRDAGRLVLPLLALHGVKVEEVTSDAPAYMQHFVVQEVSRREQPFQGHYQEQLRGVWRAPAMRTLPAGSYVVRLAQPLGVLALYLLDPQSDDGLVTWNVVDPFLTPPTGEFPVVRIVQPLQAPTRPVP